MLRSALPLERARHVARGELEDPALEVERVAVLGDLTRPASSSIPRARPSSGLASLGPRHDAPRLRSPRTRRLARAPARGSGTGVRVIFRALELFRLSSDRALGLVLDLRRSRVLFPVAPHFPRRRLGLALGRLFFGSPPMALLLRCPRARELLARVASARWERPRPTQRPCERGPVLGEVSPRTTSRLWHRRAGGRVVASTTRSHFSTAIAKFDLPSA